MKHLLFFVVLTLSGYSFGHLTGINPLSFSEFKLFASAALVFGLYAGVAGIDLEALGKYRKTALFIITAGVPLQIGLTAALMWLIYPHPVSILAAVAIDQIDPLSVSTLLNNKLGMSNSAKALLRVWASFDDPVTVLVGFSFLLPLFTGLQLSSLPTYGLALILNILPAVVLFGFYRSKYTLIKKNIFLSIVTVLSLLFAVYFQAFLFAALIALFLRPFNNDKLAEVSTFLYHIVIFIVGASLVQYGIDFRLGILLAVVEFFVVQPVSALFMVKGTTNDIFRLAFAQQNGLTTILMGITFQAYGFNILPILLPAIITINFCNLLINGYYSWKENRGEIVTKVDNKALTAYHKQLNFN